MAGQIQCDTGGISGLREFLKEHEEAIQFDLLRSGWHLWDVGRTLGWDEFRAFINWLPPTGESALWRARKPQSWWVTPEMRFLASQQYLLELANWQRGGGKGSKPKPTKFPEDVAVKLKSGEELAENKQKMRDHLARRRAETKKKRR